MSFKLAVQVAVTAIAISNVFASTISKQNSISFQLATPKPLIVQDSSNDLTVAETARSVTVRIIGNPGVGSGVIIGHQRQSYTVLTCHHVVSRTKDNRFQILTPDGLLHTARWIRAKQFGDIDLAIVEFSSNRNYQVVAIGNSQALAVSDRVYAAGFPNWHRISETEITDTHDWGLKAFRLTIGDVGMLPKEALLRGYQIGYTNNIEIGMSGGPVLNHYGQLVGINGRAKYAIRNFRVYTFNDGTVPSKEQLWRMNALSWAIPSATFMQIAR